MNSRSLLTLVSLFGISVGAAACGGSAEAPGAQDDADADEGALRTQIVPDTVGAVIEMRTPGPGGHQGAAEVQAVSIGATKVAKLFRAFKQTLPHDPIPLCHPGSTRTSMKFYGASGEVIAEGGFGCGRGQIDLANGPYRITVDEGKVDDVLNLPPVPADTLFGVTKIDVKKFARVGTAPPGEAHVKGDGVAKILDAMDVDQAIDPSFTGTRCMPTHALTFFRKDGQVARTAYVCHLDTPIPTQLKAVFIAVDPSNANKTLATGGIQINPKEIENVYAAALTTD
jgi:hypothetical protein